MAADAVYAAVERKMVVIKNVIDTDHFSECVLTATRNTRLIRPAYSDFKKIPYPASQQKLGRDAQGSGCNTTQAGLKQCLGQEGLRWLSSQEGQAGWLAHQ